MFSRSCEYAIRAAIYLASKSHEGSWIAIREISAEADVPEAFIAKIMQVLVRQKIAVSKKGPSGGFQIPENTLTRDHADQNRGGH